MQALLPGRPQSTAAALDTVLWQGQRLVAYVARSALIVLRSARDLAQTITFDDSVCLVAVAIDTASGRIAVSSRNAVYIYRPYGHEYGASVQWSLVSEHRPLTEDDDIACLSWGLNDELLIAGCVLTLLSVSDSGSRETWTQRLANPVSHAAFSHDAGLIASTGRHDRLAKIWRRGFAGGGRVRFDTAYLLHPAAVTGLWWRGRPDQETHTPSVLYTTCADHKLRIWTDVSPHCVQILEPWHELDLLSCIPPPDAVAASEERQSGSRLVFTIDSWHFKALLDDAASADDNQASEVEIHHREHLREMSAREPEVCVVLDDRGTMSAWGLDRVGHKARHVNDVLNMAYAEDANWNLDEYSHARLLGYSSSSANGNLTLLAHHMSGRVDWLECRIDRLLDPTRQPQRFRLTASSTGSSFPVKRMIPGPSGSGCFVALTHSAEAHVWQSAQHSAGDMHLRQKSLLNVEREAVDAVFLQDVSLLAVLDEIKVSLWSVADLTAVKICEATLDTAGAICLQTQISQSATRDELVLVAMTGDLQAQAWVVATTSGLTKLLPVSSPTSPDQPGTNTNRSDLECATLISYVPTDRCLRSWSLTKGADKSEKTEKWNIRAAATLRSNSSKAPRLIVPANSQYVAVVEQENNAVTLWHVDSGCIEFQKFFPDHEPVTHLTWGTAGNGVLLLGIVLPHRIHILCQTRFDHRPSDPPWICLKTINLKSVTPHRAELAVWMPSDEQTCHLIVNTVAHQMFDFSADFKLQKVNDSGKRKEVTMNILHAAAQLNANLALYHPTLLVELISAGRIDAVRQILVTLDKHLKFYTAGEPLDSSLGLDHVQLLQSSLNTSKGTKHKQDFSLGNGDETNEFSAATCKSLTASLDEIDLPSVSRRQQEQLKGLIKSVEFGHAQDTAVDLFGQQFLVESVRRKANDTDSITQPMTWREIVWAQHSTSQEILLDLTTRHLDSKLLWEQAKSLGLFMWVSDIEALKARFEVVARSEYTKTDERDPVDCSLHYLALGKKSTLAGLWRLATWNRERTPTMKLLANNFDDPRWKSAALKNAYALLGRHRTQYAAAFFLLAGNLKDCVGVLANQLGDLQLAIAVARVYEGTESAGPILTNLIVTHVLPLAARTHNTWLAVWAYGMLGKPDMALRCMTRPLYSVTGTPGDSIEPPWFQKNDPSTVYMYSWLRNKHPKAAWHISPQAERNLALGAAKTHARMGCDPLALSTARDFVFSVHVDGAVPTTLEGLNGVGEQMESFQLGDGVAASGPEAQRQQQPPSMLDAFDSTAAALPENVMQETKTTHVNGMPRKVVTHEPSAASILDAFDF